VRRCQIMDFSVNVEDALFEGRNLQAPIMAEVSAPELSSSISKPQYKDIVSTLLNNCISLVLRMSDEEVAPSAPAAPTTYPAPARDPIPSAAPLALLSKPGPQLAAAGFNSDEADEAAATGTFSRGDLQAMAAMQGRPRPTPKPRLPAAPSALPPPMSIEAMERSAEEARRQVRRKGDSINPPPYYYFSSLFLRIVLARGATLGGADRSTARGGGAAPGGK
jgi:hypothetical protein